MLARQEDMLQRNNRTRVFRTVFFFSVHNRRVYLTKIDFTPRHYYATCIGKLQSDQVVVERNTLSYRMDDVDELEELIRVIYTLFRQLEHNVMQAYLA